MWKTHLAEDESSAARKPWLSTVCLLQDGDSCSHGIWRQRQVLEKGQGGFGLCCQLLQVWICHLLHRECHSSHNQIMGRESESLCDADLGKSATESLVTAGSVEICPDISGIACLVAAHARCAAQSHTHENSQAPDKEDATAQGSLCGPSKHCLLEQEVQSA